LAKSQNGDVFRPRKSFMEERRGRWHVLSYLFSMTKTLSGRKAILVADGFEQVELTRPRAALIDAGAETVLISPTGGQVKAWDEDDFGQSFDVDLELSRADADDFDALLLPGGVMNPDTLRTIPAAVEFVKHFFAAGKPVAAICHGPQMLIEAGVVEGRKLTSFPSLKTDLRNAGAEWVDQEVVTDQGLVTSRKPADLPAFNRKMVEEFAEGVHAGQAAGVSR
jgi:protease I